MTCDEPTNSNQFGFKKAHGTELCNNSFRRLLGLPSHNSASTCSMFVNLNIPSFGELLRKYVYNFRNRLETSDNVIIRGLYSSHLPLQSDIWNWWRDICQHN